MVAVLRRCRCARLCLGGACGAAGVPGGPGCFVCPWAVARPRAVRAASFARRVVSKPGQAPPPPTGTAARPCGPSCALLTGGAVSLTCGWARRLVAPIPSYGSQPAILHVIPPWLIQTLNAHRWNCNVFVVSRKMTTLNYVRNVGGGGAVVSHGCRSLALPPAGVAAWPCRTDGPVV